MAAITLLARARAAFDQQAWTDAYVHLSAAEREVSLDPEDLDRLATAAYLIGEEAAAIDARARAHRGFVERGDLIRAARSAYWLAFAIQDKSTQNAQAAGWIARARRLLDECGTDCVEQGLILCALAFQKVLEGDMGAAHATFVRAADIGERFHDADVTALARHGQGRTLIRLKRTADGFGLLDEVMVTVVGGEIAPMIAGVIYCSVIGACFDAFDLRRAQEWTTAFEGWCEARPDMALFRGPCLIRRSELMQLHGAWPDAIEEARRACEWLGRSPARGEVGDAYYQQGELCRLRGEHADADEAYRRASQAGRKPYPGLALLRLAQGQLDAAEAAVRRHLQETHVPRFRAASLGASVEILLAKHDLAGARSASNELATVADESGATMLRASAAQQAGAVALEAGDARAAVESLRQASAWWHELDVPYETGRVRLLMGLAYRLLGDEDGAQLEFDAAAEIFERLGATPDVRRAAAVAATTPLPSAGLTGREVEVLRLIATGKTNRAIANELVISEKTVARHVSNIFTKLDLPSRSAATAYAYQHKLLS